LFFSGKKTKNWAKTFRTPNISYGFSAGFSADMSRYSLQGFSDTDHIAVHTAASTLAWSVSLQCDTRRWNQHRPFKRTSGTGGL